MEAVNPFSQFAGPVVDPGASKNNDELGQEDFMRLLVTQLENQDPTKPMDNFEFLSQIAQFGMVSGIQESQQQLTAMIESLFANRTLQATELVGKGVVTESSIAALSEGGSISGLVELAEGAANIDVQIAGANGQLVQTLQLGPLAAGRQPFAWAAIDEAGEPLPPGLYQLSAQATINGVAQAVPVFASAKVASVSVGASGQDINLHLDNKSTVAVSQVREFM